MRTSAKTVARLTVRSNDVSVLILPRPVARVFLISPHISGIYPEYRSRFYRIESFHN